MLITAPSKAERERAEHPEPRLSRDDLAIVTHPIRFARWRRDVRKNGAYAAAWDGAQEPRWVPVITLFLLVGAVAGIVLILAFA